MRCFIFIVILVSGCANQKHIVEDSMQISKGMWRGKLEQFTTKKLPDNSSDSYELVVMNCNPIPEFWMRDKDIEFVTSTINYAYVSKQGSTLFYDITQGKGWVEIQSWAIVNLNDREASVQWNRMVSNPNLSSTEELRSFGQLGYGVLKKVSDSCNWNDIKN